MRYRLTLSSELEQRTESLTSQRQRTLKAPIYLSGNALFTGAHVHVKILPAACGFGIVFQRTDLPNRPQLPAKLQHVQATPRCTILGMGGVVVQTVEHLLSALCACGVDNALIEIDGAELPIFDGSAKEFVEQIEAVGVCEQEEPKVVYRLAAPISWSQGDVHLIALPSDEYRITYTLFYPHSSIVGTQYYSVQVNEDRFKKEIAPCRTFCIYEEVAPLVEKGLIKGGGLENAVIIKDNRVANPGGLRFPDEMVRHKILDMVGDLSLMGFSFLAHIIAIRSGHSSNVAFAKQILTKMEIL